MQEQETKAKSKYSHLTAEQRLKIESGLDNRRTFKEIGEIIHKDPTTVSREVKNHVVVERNGAYYKAFNNCVRKDDCNLAYACENHVDCKRNHCVNCKNFCCTPKCNLYVPYYCPKLKKAPFVCNACPNEHNCTLEKHFYHAYDAQKEYRELLSDARQVIKCDEEELKLLDSTIQSGYRKGQSINTIYVAAEDNIPVCRSTAYNYMNRGLLTNCIRLDAPKAVRFRKTFKPGKVSSRPKSTSIPVENLTGHTYTDWLVRQSIAPEPWVEMDCVEGSKGGNGKVLLTLLFKNCDLQLSYIMEHKDTDHVAEVHGMLRNLLGITLYTRLFSLILTDRGSEFADCPAFEHGSNGEFYCEVYYCDPQCSNQKACCERNHSEIRRVLKKGKDIECSQEKISFMMDNINSLPRPQFGNRSSYDMFCFIYGQEAADALGLERIPAEDVTLKPYILS